MNTIDVIEGSQYYVQDGHGTNIMVKPNELFSVLKKIVNENNFKQVVITMYKTMEREVKIIGNVRYFEYLTRNEKGAKFVMEKYDGIYTSFRFDNNRNLVNTKGYMLVQIKQDVHDLTKLFEKLSLTDKKTNHIEKIDIHDVIDTLKSMPITNKI